MNPFTEAAEFIREHPDTGSAAAMAKLVLSLYNPIHAFSVAECLRSFDDDRLNLACRMIQHYATVGEDEHLRNVGHEVYKSWPNLVELSNAASEAKSTVRERWRKEDEAKYAEEEKNNPTNF